MEAIIFSILFTIFANCVKEIIVNTNAQRKRKRISIMSSD